MDEQIKRQIDAATDKVKTIPLSQATPLKAKAQSKGKPVPTVFKAIVKSEWMRQFDCRERLRILFGGNLVVMIGIATQHNPGAFQPLIIGKVTDQKTPDDFMRHIIANMLDKKSPPSIVQHEPEEKKK